MPRDDVLTPVPESRESHPHYSNSIRTSNSTNNDSNITSGLVV